MTAGELGKALGLTCLAGSAGLEKEVGGCLIGDLLSHALARLEAGNVWITVHGHPNVVAVGVQTGAGCVILCDGSPLDPEAGARAEAFALPVFSGEKSAFALAGEMFALGL